MRKVQGIALILLTVTTHFLDASGGRFEQAQVRATERYVKTYKEMLEGDTYYIVEQPEVNGTLEKIFEGAVGAAFSFRNFFISTDFYPALDYRGVEKDRNDLLSYTADFLNSTHATLNSLCIPFGSENCGFLPDGLHYEMASTMRKLVEDITQQTDRIRKELDGGSFVASYNQISGIIQHCDAFVPIAKNYWLNTKRNRSEPLDSLIGRGCDTAAGNPFSTNDAIKLREGLAEYAKSHALGGGNDNRCLQVFAARYTGYSRDAMKVFKQMLGKYVTIKGFCYYFANEGAWLSPLPSAENETLELVLNVRAGMELLNEFSLNDTPLWSMKKAANDVLGGLKGELESARWANRDVLHKNIVNETISKLENHTSSYVFNALAFLPDDRNDRQCRQFPEDRVVDVGYQNLNFFVLYANESRKPGADQAWDNLTDKEDAGDAIVDQVFAKSSEDLCERLRAALKDKKIDAFRGVAAVRCGYEFVWYELGYTYFYAAYSSTDYKWEKKGGSYDAKCGQIFFFP